MSSHRKAKRSKQSGSELELDEKPVEHMASAERDPSEEDEGLSQQSIEVLQMQMQSGPLPSPEILHKYQLVRADIVDHILKRAETEQKNRYNIQLKHLALVDDESKNTHQDIRRGQLCGLAVCLAGFAAVVPLALTGFGGPAAALGAAVVGGTMITQFIGRRQDTSQKKSDASGDDNSDSGSNA